MMMRSLYTLVLRLLLPLALLRLYWRSIKAPTYRHRVPERLALGAPAPPAQVWIHAVSVGEVQAAEPLIRGLRARHPGLQVLVTTTTPTGAQRLRDRFGEEVAHRYTPYDLPGVMARFLDQIRPTLVIVLETEIWPNMLARCAARAIPVILANARLSERSAAGYRRLASLTRATLKDIDLIAAQSHADAQRFIALGADPSRVETTGSIKFDLHRPASLLDQSEAIRRLWGVERPVWVAASTHEGEEELLLKAHRRIRAAMPTALLVLVPRHPERFERVAELVDKTGFRLVRRSRKELCEAGTAVFLGDTMGELQAFIAAADAAFIGGSLVPSGGHNLLEAAAVGVPAVIGPHHFNFAAITEMLTEAGGAAVVRDAEELAQCMIEWLSDAPLRARVGEQGQRVVEMNRGAVERLLSRVEDRLRR